MFRRFRFNKYNNIRTYCDGKKMALTKFKGAEKFDSKKEAKRFMDLKEMEKKKEIRELKLQPEFVLQVKFRDREGNAHRDVKYRADFSYKQGKEWVVEDVKGRKTELYLLKKKLFLFKFPKVVFKEV